MFFLSHGRIQNIPSSFALSDDILLFYFPISFIFYPKPWSRSKGWQLWKVFACYWKCLPCILHIFIYYKNERLGVNFLAIRHWMKRVFEKETTHHSELSYTYISFAVRREAYTSIQPFPFTQIRSFSLLLPCLCWFHQSRNPNKK